jgi:hypothetical protein
MLIGVCRIGEFGFDFKNAGFTQLGESVLRQFMEDGVVCPAILQKGLFTTSAVDNIDHNHSATTATISCHGTGISVFQHLLKTKVSNEIVEIKHAHWCL